MRRPVLLAIALLAAPSTADAIEWDLATSHQLFTQSLPDDVAFALLRYPGEDKRTLSRTSYQLSLSASLSGRPADAVGLQLGIDTGLVEIDGDGLVPNSATVAQSLLESGLLGATFIELQLGEGGFLQIRAGKLDTEVGSHAVFSSYGLGASLELDPSYFDPDNPWRFSAHAILPDPSFTAAGKTNPLFDASLGYAIDNDNVVRLSAAMFVDTDDGLSGVIADEMYRSRITAYVDDAKRFADSIGALWRSRQELVEAYNAGVYGYEPQTSGLLWWFGLSGAFLFDRFAIDANATFQFGRFEATVTPNAAFESYIREIVPEDPINDFERNLRQFVDRSLRPQAADTVEVISFFAELSASWLATDWMLAELYALFVTGDAGFAEQDPAVATRIDHSFISLVPDVRYTSIFFDGGVSQTVTFPTVTSIAPDGAGLIAVGGRVRLEPVEDLSVELVAAWYGSNGGVKFDDDTDTVGTTGGSYGVEANLRIGYQLFDWVRLAADGAIFQPGDYYGEGLPLAYQIIAGIQAAKPARNF